MTPTDELLKEVVGMLRETTEQLDSFVLISINSPRWRKHRDFRGFCDVAKKKVENANALLAKVDAQSDEEM